MSIKTNAQKNTLAQAYADAVTHAALYTTSPTSSAGAEPTGGTPAYARKPLTWGSPSNGVIAASPVVFDVPAGTSIQGAGLHTALTAGTYLDGGDVIPQSFASQGTYTLTVTYTQT